MVGGRYFTGRFRLLYFVVMLTAIGLLLWYIRQTLAPYDELLPK